MQNESLKRYLYLLLFLCISQISAQQSNESEIRKLFLKVSQNRNATDSIVKFANKIIKLSDSKELIRFKISAM